MNTQLLQQARVLDIDEQIELVEATAFRRLNDAAIEAARRALYKPHTENGVPQPAWALVALSFQLRR